MMSSDVILDTASCLPYRRHLVFVPSSSRPRYVIISYRIPDDIKTQSITCDTGYDDIRFARPSPRPISSPYCFPPRFPPNRVARRVGSRLDAILPATRSLALPAYSSRSISSAHLIGSSVPPVACPPYQPHAVARPPSSHVAHPSHPPSLISSGSSPVPLCFPLCFPPGVPPHLLARLVHLIHLIHLIRFAPSHWFITHANRMRRATSRRNGAHDGQSTTGKKERHDIRQLPDTANTPPRPPYSPYSPYDARTPTTNTQTGKRPLQATHNASDGTQGGTTNETPLLVDTTTRCQCLAHPPQCRLLIADDKTRRLRPPHDTSGGTQNITANCYPPHDTKNGTKGGTKKREEKRDDERDEKNGPPLLNEKRPEKRDEI